MVKPPRLEPGNQLAIVAPASPFDHTQFQAGVAEVERLGFKPLMTEGLFDRRAGYLAGDAEHRADVLGAVWRDPSVGAVIGARGGYGSAQLLPWLEQAKARGGCKPFVGHSDLTALLVYLTTHCGLVCFHGPLVVNLASGEAGYDRDSFLRSLTKPEPMGELAAEGMETVRPGQAAGRLLGGTLTQLVASLGTPYAFAPPPGYVLLLDEVGERPYRVDRMLTQLIASGVLGRASAVVCGELPGCDEQTGWPTARGVVADLLAEFPGPVLTGFPTGHTSGAAFTVPLGVTARVVAGPEACLVVTEGAVK